jgi:dTDP-4-amino-4,6-dideoxygalactose transaminase
LVTNDPELQERCWSLHNVGRLRGGAWYHHENLGLNLRMTEWQGAVLLAQLERLEEHYPRRERAALMLASGLSDIEGLDPLPSDPRVTRHARHLFPMRYNPANFGGQPAKHFVEALSAEGITPVSPGYVPLHHTPAIRKTMRSRFNEDPAEIQLPHTEFAAEHTVWVAQNALLGDQEDIADILAAIRKVQRGWGGAS